MKTIFFISNLTLFTRVSDPFLVYLDNGLSKGIMVILTLTITINLTIIIFVIIIIIIIIVVNIIVIIIFLFFQGPQWGSLVP